MRTHFPFVGHLPQANLYGGLIPYQEPPSILMPSRSIAERFQAARSIADPAMLKRLEDVQLGRANMGNEDVQKLIGDIWSQVMDVQRTITSTMTAFPVRENLEAEAKILVPLDTPVRNRLRRVPGSGKSTAWKQLTSLGGGFGFQTTVTTGASSATQTVGSTAGMRAGDILWFATTAAARTVSSITNATTVVLTATISTTTAETVTNTTLPAGAGANANSQLRAFFAETGAPAAHTSVYADKSVSYKLLGTYYDVTGFAMAAGANYQNQYQVEQANAIRNLMLNEENALINGSSTAVTPPWGDGTTAYGFDGLVNLITTANGTPTAQVQTSVGALTTAHVDAQLRRVWEQGGQRPYMLVSPQESLSLAHLADANGSIIRIMQTADGIKMGKRVVSYVHPLSGEECDVITSRYVVPGTMFFLSDALPDGTPTLDVDVLPQVQLPELAPNEDIQGYTAQVLAPTTAAPQVYPGIVTVYEALRLKSALHVAVSSGLTAV